MTCTPGQTPGHPGPPSQGNTQPPLASSGDCPHAPTPPVSPCCRATTPSQKTCGSWCSSAWKEEIGACLSHKSLLNSDVSFPVPQAPTLGKAVSLGRLTSPGLPKQHGQPRLGLAATTSLSAVTRGLAPAL